MIILGISAYYHDSSAAIIQDGEIICAIQEERISRIKHDSRFPINSIKECLKFINIRIENIDYIVFYDKPFTKFERILETYLSFAPKGFLSFKSSLPIWIKEKLFQKNSIIKELSKIYNDKKFFENKLLFTEHHLSHASSAFFPSPFENAAILTMDGVGEWTTTSLAIGKNNNIEIIKEIKFPHSLGLLYSAFTYYTGFKVNSGEYKLMGLAPYGVPKYTNLIKKYLIDIKEDGSFRLDMSYFNYCVGLTMTNKKFHDLFGGKPRISETKITQKEMDIAASIQNIIEEIIIKLCISIKKETNLDNLCIAGGVALNCVANGKLQKNKIFKNIWIQPASGDAGGSIGAALSTYYMMLNNKRTITKTLDGMKGSYLGPKYDDIEIEKQLLDSGANFTKLDEKNILEYAANEISKGKAIGWMTGRMEFGPRALGSRSIIADPRSEKMQKILNLKVKYRESFRPFAPSILFEDLKDWFDLDVSSPYMLLVSNVNQDKLNILDENQNNLKGFEKLNLSRSKVPAITHVDNTARIQTVHKETNLKFYNLIKEFKKITNCPILINTSFNIRGEPIVCSPNDAYRCFMGTDLDILIIENFVMKKEEQSIKNNIRNYKHEYTLD